MNMKSSRWTHSLKSRIVVSYSLILIIGGLSTSMLGIHFTGQALLEQARQQTVYGLSAARSIYVHRLQELRQSVELLASSGQLQAALAANQPMAAVKYLTGIRQEHGLDFLSVTDPTGRVIVRTSGDGTTGDVVTALAPIEQALGGESAAGTEIIPCGFLQAEDPALTRQAAIRFAPTAKARPIDTKILDAGMTLLAAAPATDESGHIIAVVYAGQLLNHPSTNPHEPGPHWIVDKINHTLTGHLQSAHKEHGAAATIFQSDVRITTNITTAEGERAVGTRASQEVYDAVMLEGKPWIGRAFGVNDWYITAYEPITNLAGERVGMLCVGLLEQPYTAVRDKVTLIFAGIALFCFLLIVVVTYFLTRSMVRPLEEMVSVSQSIAADDLSRRVHVTGQSEFGLLSSSFNDMLDRISQMKTQLEQWAKTLEQKVEERTQQLVKVQTQVARQQRLASGGQLAAGVAHEINNPLGGILTFSSLVLEELPEDSHMHEDMQEIVRQAIRCRKIVTELLEFSRQREAQMTSASINEVVSRTLALLEKQALFYDINLTRKFDPDMPMTVVDESQMQQVFMNIILNAVDAMSERGDLTIETGHKTAKKQVWVRISDTGCGIPPEIREAIFDPFFTTKDPGKGTGLGLAVACRIVQDHGGRTEVESELGKGTTFTISLPVTAT
ncbi:MAG: cache domain-containing protein [Phycisphaerae bacterium]|nr:cache domain-containing protein [Phycisphaerae bacterium]